MNFVQKKNLQPLLLTTTSSHSTSKISQDSCSGVNIDTCVGNADSVLQLRGMRDTRLESLLSGFQIRLDHDTRNCRLSVLDLLRNVSSYDGLICVNLFRISVRTIHNKSTFHVRLLTQRRCGLDTFGIVVRSASSTSKNDMRTLVSLRTYLCSSAKRELSFRNIRVYIQALVIRVILFKCTLVIAVLFS